MTVTKRDLLSLVRGLGASREIVADVARLYAFAITQPYLPRRRATLALWAYGGARARSDELATEGNEKLAASALRSAGLVLDEIGLSPKSRRRAIANAKRRRAAGTKGSG